MKTALSIPNSSLIFPFDDSSWTPSFLFEVILHFVFNCEFQNACKELLTIDAATVVNACQQHPVNIRINYPLHFSEKVILLYKVN